jgi:hypothetical protein
VVDGHERDTPEQRVAAIANSKKPSVLILDFVGNSGRHRLMTTADILAGNISDEAVERAEKMVKESGADVRMDTALEIAEEEIKAEKEKARLAEEAKRRRLLAKSNYTTRTVNPFDAMGLSPQADRGWDTGKQLSDAQKGVLLKQGIDPTGMNYAAAKQLLNEIFRRWTTKECSWKQANILKKFGYPGNMSQADAKKTIDEIAKSGWKMRAPSSKPAMTEEEAYSGEF